MSNSGMPPFFPPNTPLPAVTPPPIPFDNGITDIPDTQSFPDNGPYRPPFPPTTAQPQPGTYEYINVPKLPVVPPTAPYAAAFTAYQQIESELSLRGVYADRIDLIDGRRVYRVLTQYIWKFPFDRISSYIPGGPPQPEPNSFRVFTPVQWRFQSDDPTIGFSALHEWTALLG